MTTWAIVVSAANTTELDNSQQGKAKLLTVRSCVMEALRRSKGRPKGQMHGANITRTAMMEGVPPRGQANTITTRAANLSPTNLTKRR
jgi:hypothetical protein